MDSKYAVGGSAGGAVWSQSPSLFSILRVILFCLSYELVFHPYRQCINTSIVVVDTNVPDRYLLSAPTQMSVKLRDDQIGGHNVLVFVDDAER